MQTGHIIFIVIISIFLLIGFIVLKFLKKRKENIKELKKKQELMTKIVLDGFHITPCFGCEILAPNMC